MTTPAPETNTPPEPKRRTRRAAAPTESATEESAAPAKPRRKRKTKAEKEAERAAKMAADAAKPLLEPKAWMTFGLLLAFVGVCVYFDPVGFENSSSGQSEPWIQTLIVLLIAFTGKNPVAIVFGALGLLAMGLGVRGWFRERADQRRKLTSGG
ncbi:MAG: hypothetical protein K8J31_18190 [Anaerolineae bacterium]|nr:hypothetical protein [Anaerolineae bacterium]